MLKNFQFLKVTEKIDIKSRLVGAPKNFKFAPIRKRFRDSETTKNQKNQRKKYNQS